MHSVFARLVQSLLFASLAALLGCAARNGGNAVFGVRYLEIPVSDIERAVDFYEFVFGVELDRVVVDGYEMAHFPTLGDVKGADVTLYAKKEVAPGTWVAEFEDSEGNRMTLSQSSE